MAARTNRLLIATPEGIEFTLLLAAPTTRFMAFLVDLAVVAVLVIIVFRAILGLGALVPGFAFAVFVLVYFLIQVGYAISFEWFWRGQTLGKRLLRLRVVDEDGLRLQFSQIAMRNLLRGVDALPALYLVGGLACLISRRYQRLGDYAANTVVVRNPVVVAPDLDQIMARKYNSFRDYPHLCARLRQKVSPEVARVALQAVLRRDRFEPDARIELFQAVADHFRRLVQFPEEATFGLTDEHYVRNVVDTVFRPAPERAEMPALSAAGRAGPPANVPR